MHWLPAVRLLLLTSKNPSAVPAPPPERFRLSAGGYPITIQFGAFVHSNGKMSDA